MSPVKLCLKAIQKKYPDLTILSTQMQDHGQNNLVLTVNAEWIFRFPRYAGALENMRKETRLLQQVQDFVTLPIPLPVYLNLDAPLGQAFSGYRLLHGVPLWKDTFASIQDENVLNQLASDLASFLRALHNIPLSQIFELNLCFCDINDQWLNVYQRIQNNLFPKMRPDARRDTAEHFETFLNNPALLDYDPVLKHGDFGASNILYDPKSQRISGIIDFEHACMGDPAYDLAGLMSCYGEDFIRRCARTYPEIDLFFDRIQFYSGTFALLEALFGLENGDEAAYYSGMTLYV